MTDVHVSIVIPVTNPEIDVGMLVQAYSAPLRRAGYAYEFVFVLDSVTGRPERELLALQDEFPVTVVRLQGGGLGESIALSAGVDRAKGRLIINAPAYLQSEPEDVLKVITALESGADFVATWRHPRVDPWFNRLQSRLFNWVLRVLMGIKFHDLNSNLRGMRRQVLDDVAVYGELYRFLPVLALRQGFRVVEVTIRHREERGRRGFFGFGVYLRRMLDILAITFLTRFTEKPLRFFGTVGILLILVGLALSVEPLVGKFSGEAGLSNKPIIVLAALLVAFGVQLIGFGLVGEIIIFTQARNLRDFKIDEVVEHSSPVVPAAQVADNHAEPRVREVVPGEDARWDAWIRAHPEGSFFHLSGWRKVVEETFHHQPHYLVAERGRKWEGVFPMFFTRGPFLGSNLVSVPYAVYGGILSESDAAARSLRDYAERLGRRLRAGYVEMRHDAQRFDDLPTSDLYVTFRKQVAGSGDDILATIPKRARAEVRRARDKFGLSFAESTDLDEFYHLFQVNKRKLGSPPLPKRWFAALVDEFGRDVVLHIVRLPGGPSIAAVMSFRLGETLFAYYSGALHEHYKTGVNDFIYFKIMEWCALNGVRTFDFGRSRRDTGPANFKRNMGFEAEPLHYEYLLLADGAALPRFHPGNPRLSLPRRVWSAMPGFMTTRLGGPLSKYLP
ncbi:MAG: FemAB family PEP-CTERM system-associated protein [Planctomycetota bacterium]